MSGSSFEASVDDAPFAAVTLPLTLTGLADGDHSIAIRASDGAGNVDATPATFTWTVDATPPAAEIVFPPAHSSTDATTITVRGTSSDAHGLTAVSVNGIAATTSDEYQTWTAQVSLSTGTNEIVVAATDGAGNVVERAATASITNRGVQIARAGGIDYDATGKRLIVADTAAGQVYAVDDEGNATVLRARTTDVPVPFHGLAIDAAHNRALVLTTVTLSAVDLSSGELSTITQCGPPIGMSSAADIAVDSANNRAFFVTSKVGSTPPMVVQVDMNNGSCTVIASDTVGSGQWLADASAIEYDAATNPSAPRILVGTADVATIVTIDPTSYTRQEFVTSGATLNATGEMKLDAANDRLLVLDPQQGAVVGIDLNNGARTSLAGADVGSGPNLLAGHGLAIDAAANTIFTSQEPGEILSINAQTLARQTFVNSQVGAGARMSSTWGLAIEQVTGTPKSLLVAEAAGLTRVDLATGDREVVLSPTVGNGPYPGRITTFVMNTRPDKVGQVLGVMRGTNYYLFSADLSSGDRYALDLGLPSATHLVNDVRHDVEGNRLIFGDADSSVTDDDAIYAIDLTTGLPTTLSDSSTGSGPRLNFPSNSILEPVSNPTRAIVSNANDHNILSVDLATGARSVISTGTSANFLPAPLYLDATASRLLGFDDYGYNLFAMDLNGGTPQLISGVSPTTPINLVTAGHGPMLVGASGLDVDVASGVAYITQTAAGSVMAIDLTSGDRVVISR
ncbi:MAG TPA: hypothetical protein VFS24_17010 [Steroidobacteraceae bacterium]|nr:hypothetical protein [Steroidobacteraceae bacterium]